MEIGELVSVANTADDEVKCPFCNKKLHDFKKRENPEATTVVKSKPKQLKCTSLSGGGEGKYTTAAHHLICAKQCYAMLKPIVRMGSLVGYDVNDKPNGLALPTLWNPYSTARSGRIGAAVKYGLLSDDQMNKVSYWAMDKTKKQWHVGSHNFEQQDQWDYEEFGDEEEMLHVASYDSAVLSELYLLWQNHNTGPTLCEDDPKNEYDLKADLDNLSAEIKEEIESFSSPYFVSKRAEGYAKRTRNRR